MPRKLKSNKILRKGIKLKQPTKSNPIKIKKLPKPFTRIVKIDLKKFLS